MTVRTKALLILGSTIVFLVAFIRGMAPGLLMQDSLDLERQTADGAVNRLLDAVARDIDDLDTTVWDWAAWDDTCEFMDTGSTNYVTANLIDGTFDTLRLNLLAFVHADGRIAWAKAYDRQAREGVPIPPGFLRQIEPGRRLVAHSNEQSVVRGLVRFDGEVLMISSRPIVTSEEQGPVRGTLLMGRLLGAATVRHWGLLKDIRASLEPPDSPVLPADIRSPHAAFSSSGAAVVRPLDDNTIDAYGLLRDLQGEPCAVLRVRSPRTIYHAEGLEVAYFILVLAAAALIVGAVAFLILEGQVLGRLERLGRQVAAVQPAETQSARFAVEGNDEIAALAVQFNRLLERLAAAMSEQRALHAELEQRVADRTAELSRSQDQLRQLYRRMEHLREEERRRVAERVHNDLGQLATVLKMEAEWALARLGDATPAVSGRLTEMVGLVESMAGTIRDIAMDLRPSVLDDLGLQAAVQWTAQRLAERAGIRCDLEIGEFTLEDPDTATAVYRIAQELLTNVVRHAKAATLFVRLQREGDTLHLEVEDDGRGILEQELSSTDSFGLSGVRERVAALRGTLDIGRRPAGGTRVFVQVPLTPCREGP